MKRGLVLGCGAVVGCAWSIGTLRAVEEALGWDAREADVIVGTSAGAELALMLGSGVASEALIAAQRDEAGADPMLAAHFALPSLRPSLPRLRPGNVGALAAGVRRRAPLLNAAAGLLPAGGGDLDWLAQLADALVPDGGWVAHPATWMVAMDARSGARVAFGSPGAPPAAARDAVRASWAVPGLFGAVAIGDRRYADGGILSPTSADLVRDRALDEVVVIAPMASTDPGPARSVLARGERLLRGGMTRALDREVAELKRAGVRVLRLEPGAEDLEAMGPNFTDARRRLPALAAGLRLGPQAVGRDGARRSGAEPPLRPEHD